MYVDALLDRKNEVVHFVTRINGKRQIETHQIDHHFYVEDPRGTYRSIWGHPLKRMNPSTSSEKRKLLAQIPSDKVWESDINAIMRTIETQYKNSEAPKLHVAFFDIETAFDTTHGYSDPADALNNITSIAVYLQWAQTMVCLAIPPATMTYEEACEVAGMVGDTIVFKTESEMLNAFIDLVEDADVLSGWNSTAYDIPYTINRIIRVLGKNETRRLSVFGQLPIRRTFEIGGREQNTYEIPGKLHLDYMDLYRKYTYEEKQSYALNAIAEIELGEQKVEYDGSLHQLYNYDFKKFLEYNIKDTMLLEKLDRKLQYIDLCNAIAHANHVLVPTTMGTVAMIDQAVLIEAHENGMIVPDNKSSTKESRAAGGWVAKPKRGLHTWVGSSDLNSLYPSVIRALNMSPETIVGQVDLSETYMAIAKWEKAAPANTFAKWWNDRFYPLEMEHYIADDDNYQLTLKLETGEDLTITGHELQKLVKESGQPWCISANGTIFRTDKVGVIPGLLSRWYRERKELQAQMKAYNTLEFNEKNLNPIKMPDHLFTVSDIDDGVEEADHCELSSAFKPKDLKSLIEAGDRDRVVAYMNRYRLTVKEGQVCFRDIDKLKFIIGFWDKRQLVKKINLNSAYGALLNVGSRFFDQRIGQSTTLTGRNITRHMAAKTNELLTGIYDHGGECIIYGDSVTGDTLLKTSFGDIPIEEVFESYCNQHYNEGDREYGIDADIKVMSYDDQKGVPYLGSINYVYRHKVSKALYEIEDEHGNVVTVTEDHSIMVERDGELVEVKPTEITEEDTIISLVEE